MGLKLDNVFVLLSTKKAAAAPTNLKFPWQFQTPKHSVYILMKTHTENNKLHIDYNDKVNNNHFHTFASALMLECCYFCGSITVTHSFLLWTILGYFIAMENGFGKSTSKNICLESIFAVDCFIQHWKLIVTWQRAGLNDKRGTIGHGNGY